MTNQGPIVAPAVPVTTVSTAELLAKIEKLTVAERITKALLGELSRELLSHYQEHEDITLINALLGMCDKGAFRLTPLNWRIAVQYFHSFIPHASNYEKGVKDWATKASGKRIPLVFTKKNPKAVKRVGDALTEWLADATNNIWLWSENVDMEVQAPDYGKKVEQAIIAAMAEDKGAMALSDVFTIIMGVDGVDIAGIMQVIADQKERVLGDAVEEAA